MPDTILAASHSESVRPPSTAELRANSILRHGVDGTVGPIVGFRRWIGNFTAEEFYEVTVDRLVNPETRWLDVGCGRDLMPMSPPLAGRLSERCATLVGIDPDKNVLENPFIHQGIQVEIEDFESQQPFDLVTLRMVVEHIAIPRECVAALKRFTKPGSYVILHTPHRFSFTSLISSMVPNRLHNSVKKILWNTEERDTFPTHYRMNTVRALRHFFTENGFLAKAIWKVDDAALFHNFPRLGRLELSLWSAFRFCHIPYPERNLVAVFQRI